MQLFGVVSAEKIIALCARGCQLTTSRKHSLYSIFSNVSLYPKKIDISIGSRIMQPFINIEMLLWNYNIMLPTGRGFLTNANKNLFLHFLCLESKPYTLEFSV